MIVGALKENGRGEARVAVTPQSVPKLIKLGYEVMVETRAGILANFPDELYTKAGATIGCLLYTSPSPRDKRQSRMPSSA